MVREMVTHRVFSMRVVGTFNKIENIQAVSAFDDGDGCVDESSVETDHLVRNAGIFVQSQKCIYLV